MDILYTINLLERYIRKKFELLFVRESMGKVNSSALYIRVKIRS